MGFRASPTAAETEPERRGGLRILHILNHTHRLNGHVHAAVDLACAQAALGHHVSICSAGGSFDALLAANDVETIVLDQERRPGTVLKAIVNLIRQVRRAQADVVHAHMMTSALLAWPACLIAGIPLVTTVHNEFQKSSTLMGIGTRVIAVSAAVARSMARRGVPRSRLRVVLNGTIGAARFEGSARTPKRLASPSVLFVGGLHPRKGLMDLVAAFAIVHRSHAAAHLTVVGEGPHRVDYEAAAAAAGCAEAVTFTGALEDPRAYMRGADVFVLPSHADPAPLVLSEAREAGCAIVATDVDGIPELLEGGAAGILVPPRDPERLAAAILSLVDDPAALAAWRRNSQVNIGHMTIDRVARETLAIYAECSRAPAKDADAALPRNRAEAGLPHPLKGEV